MKTNNNGLGFLFLLAILVSIILMISSENKRKRNQLAKTGTESPVATEMTAPGIQPDEVFITNISTTSYWKLSSDGMYIGLMDEVLALPINFNKIGWKTKRLGNKAYDRDGNLLKDCRPVFAKKSELQKAGLIK